MMNTFENICRSYENLKRYFRTRGTLCAAQGFRCLLYQLNLFLVSQHSLGAFTAQLWCIYIMLHAILSGFFSFTLAGRFCALVLKEKDDNHPTQSTPILHIVSVQQMSTESECAQQSIIQNSSVQDNDFFLKLSYL